MAAPAHIDAIMRDRYLKGGQLSDQIFKNVALFDALNKKTNISSNGNSIKQRLRIAGTQAKAYSGLDTFDTVRGDFATYAEWDFAHIVASIAIAGEDIRRANSKEDMVNLVDEHMTVAMLSAKEKLHTDLMLSTSTGAYLKSPNGFALAFADGTASYGGLTSTDESTWVPQSYATEIDVSSTFTDAQLMIMIENLIHNVTDNASPGMRPTKICTTRAIFSKLGAYAMGKTQINVGDARSASGKAMAALGHDIIELAGVPVFVDNNCPAKYMYAWSDESLFLQIDPQANFAPLPGSDGKTMKMEKVPRADAYAMDIVISCQLITPERRALSVISNVKTS